MDRVPVYILAGGKSSRFGTDKARAESGGVPIIVRLAHAVRPVASSITVVANIPEKYADLHLCTISDRIPGLGPLGGLQAALEDCKSEGWLLLLSCDSVGIRTEWVDRLFAHRRIGAQAVLFRNGRWEPLLALYHTSIRETVDRHIAERRLAMWALVETATTVALPIPPDWFELRNVNMPTDLPESTGCRQQQTT